MRRLLRGLGILVGAAAFLVAAPMAFIEIGREVVTLRTPSRIRPCAASAQSRVSVFRRRRIAWIGAAG
jgi:hypothetical protein